jgi:CubicO group peptidase (beta-lactamase class C family)
MIDVVNSGDGSAMRAFADANFSPNVFRVRDLSALEQLLDLHRRSKGLTLLSIDVAQPSFAAATFRNNVTGITESMGMQVEPQPPHRILGLPTMVGSGPSGPQISGSGKLKKSNEKAQLKDIQALAERLADADLFSGVVLIARDGKPILAEAYGRADRVKGTRNTLETPFLIGSMNKLFTGLAIGQLVEQGKLSYDDPLSKFIPDFPDSESAKKIKIKHLLSHTAGLGNYRQGDYFKSLDLRRDVRSTLAAAGRERPLFEPGTSWFYSNTGPLLLGRVIEVVTGQDYYDYMAKAVFEPAGMKNSGFPHLDRGERTAAIPYDIAVKGNSWEYADQSFRTERRGSPAGGGVATAADLLRLANALRAGKLVSPATLQLHSTPKPELGSPRYGYGFSYGLRGQGRELFGHGGNDQGQCSAFEMLRGGGAPSYTIIVLSNLTWEGCMPVVRKIIGAFAPGAGPPPPGGPTPVNISVSKPIGGSR